ADDPAIEGRDITFQGNGATLMAYQARPRAASGPLPVVLVCHENRGLVEHIRDVARRFAKEGYLACAVDLLSREGGTASVADQSQIPGILSNTDPARHVGDFQATVDFYKGQPDVARADRIGMNGFCFGGGITWRAATQIQDLRAAVPFYGPPPPLDQVPNIRAAVFGVYSSDPNDFANNGRDQLEAALKAAGVTYQFKVYPGTQHAFHNDTGPRYNEQQALAAWRDTLDWFGRYLKA
ncbi:MAG: dienelactone hydrolase family protein, partial [Thermomicrobiaceae bacterium]|nr:dienelactone hydrolase family protein [Thermomicrobiaceae bacterium]